LLQYVKSPANPKMVGRSYLKPAICHADFRRWGQILDLSRRYALIFGVRYAHRF